jgi:hypothetical protein
MPKSVIVLVAIPLIVGWSMYLITRAKGFEGPLDFRGPVFSGPDVIDLGPRADGPAETRFMISNPGHASLEISRIQIGGGCTVVYAAGTSDAQPLHRLSVPPGSTTILVARVSLRREVGADFRTSIQFSTNDPARPEVPGRVVRSQKVHALSDRPGREQSSGIGSGCQLRTSGRRSVCRPRPAHRGRGPSVDPAGGAR